MRLFEVKFTVQGESTYFTFTYSIEANDAVAAIEQASAKLKGNHVLIGTTITKVHVQPSVKGKIHVSLRDDD